MKFSKILTTAMMSAALVASSSALASETTWWSMDFDGLTIAEDGSLTNTLNNAYGTSQNGWWTTEEGDQSSIDNGQLKLNTQGTDLTWTPNGDNDTTAITYIDADVTFVGSDAAPTVTETDIHTAVYLKNLVDDTTSEVTNSVLCAWVKTAEGNAWVDLHGVTIKNEETHALRIMLEKDQLSFFIDDTLLSDASGENKLFSAKVGAAGKVDSVSFRGTGFVDNFAASQEAAAVIGTTRIIGSKVFLDNSDVTSEWSWMHYLSAEYNGTDLSLTGDSYQTTVAWNVAADPTSGAEIAKIAAIKLVSDTQSFEIVYDAESGEFSTDSTLSVVAETDAVYGTSYEVYVDTDNLVADAEYTLEFYYGEYTSSEPEPEPDPEPVKLATPVVSSSVTDTTVTLTWEAVENAVSYDVTFGDTTTTVTELTFTASELTAETTYTFAVVANGDDKNYVDSDAATVEVTTAAAEPEPEFAPVAVTGITVDGDTVTLAIDGEYTEVQVYFSETVDGTFAPIESTFADGVATVTSTTATGFFKVEAK